MGLYGFEVMGLKGYKVFGLYGYKVINPNAIDRAYAFRLHP